MSKQPSPSAPKFGNKQEKPEFPVVSVETPAAGSLGPTPAKIDSVEPDDDKSTGKSMAKEPAINTKPKPFPALATIVAEQIPDLVAAIPSAMLRPLADGAIKRADSIDKAEEDKLLVSLAKLQGINVDELRKRLATPVVEPAPADEKSEEKEKGERGVKLSEADLSAVKEYLPQMLVQMWVDSPDGVSEDDIKKQDWDTSYEGVKLDGVTKSGKTAHCIDDLHGGQQKELISSLEENRNRPRKLPNGESLKGGGLLYLPADKAKAAREALIARLAANKSA